MSSKYLKNKWNSTTIYVWAKEYNRVNKWDLLLVHLSGWINTEVEILLHVLFYRKKSNEKRGKTGKWTPDEWDSWNEKWKGKENL